jgi:peroxiredoxin
LVRLKKALKNPDFEILAINIGEPKDKITAFTEPLNLNFPVLIDPKAESVERWKIYAYPSNFLLGKNGKITHSYYGALTWDDPEIVEVIRQALEKSEH